MKKQWEEQFSLRFKAHEDELKWLYMELYHGDRQAYDYYAGMLKRCYEERSEALKKLDEARGQNPGWYREQGQCAMVLDVRSFAKDLAGLRKKLDYAKDCGVRCLHLLSIFKTPADAEPGCGLRCCRELQPELGSMEELADLAAECRERGISLGADFVLNTEAEQGPALDYANSMVFNDMTENLLLLANQGISAFHLKGLSLLWKAEEGSPVRDLQQVHSLLRMLRMACDIVCPGALLLEEAATVDKDGAAHGVNPGKPECHMLISGKAGAGIWNAAATHDARALKHSLEQAFAQPDRQDVACILRQPEGITWDLDYGCLEKSGLSEASHRAFLNEYYTGRCAGSQARGALYEDARTGETWVCGTAASLCGLEAARETKDKDQIKDAISRDLMMHACLFSLCSVPVIISGDEIAMKNAAGAEEDEAGEEKDACARQMNLGSIDWRAAGRRGNARTVEARVFNGIKALEEIRAGKKAFRPEADVWMIETGCSSVLGIGRYLEGEKFVALYNFANEAVTLTLDEVGDFTDLISGKAASVKDILVPAGSFVWLGCSFK